MPNDITTPFTISQRPDAGVEEPLPTEAASQYSDEELLALWKDIKEEALANRWMFERQWQRNIWYVLGRQWIEYMSNRGGWRDKRIAQWIPRPVTNKCKETLQAIRAMFTSIQLGVNVRPNGRAPENVAAAATADELAPVLHEKHDMNAVLNEFDFWLIATGNAFIHSFVDYDIRNGVIEIQQEQCQGCGAVYGSDKLAGAQPVCPDCGGTQFAPAVDEMGEPIPPVTKVQGKPTTIALSPLELAFSNNYARFSEVPLVVRMRWRPKRWFQNHPKLSTMLDLDSMPWQKSPTDQSLQIFTNLSKYSDLGLSPTYNSSSEGGGSEQEDGLVEYETWMKPTVKYPDGLVFRVYGDGPTPIIAHLEEDEQIPGPLPYKQADGTPLFTFAHAPFEHMGGRVLGSGPLDVIIQKQDQLNQLDSMILLIIQRMSNPVWLKPKGSEIQKLTGMPGLVISYTPSMLGGTTAAKPERIPGVPVDSALFQIREQYLRDIEELTGTFDILKGSKPAGVEAFAAMQLLVERSQSRFASVFQSRGDVYKHWFKFAIELEREFGPDVQTKETLKPGRGWTFQAFKRSQLNGSFSIVVEDGTAAPKTSLGMRAALDHAAGLGMVNLQDPDQQYAGLQLFGLQSMVPGLDIAMQSALQKQQAFEEWIGKPENQQLAAQLVAQYQQDLAVYQQQAAAAMQTMEATMQPMDGPQPPVSPMAQTPLKWRKWYRAQIHYNEFLKWANSDDMRDLINDPKIGPVVEALLTLHQVDIENALAQEMPAAPGPNAAGQTLQQTQMVGAARSMVNSNQNAGSAERQAPPGRSA